jgi:hypothetical protein
LGGFETHPYGVGVLAPCTNVGGIILVLGDCEASRRSPAAYPKSGLVGLEEEWVAGGRVRCGTETGVFGVSLTPRSRG